MNPEKTQEQREASLPGTHLENLLMNGEKNAAITHTLLEHHLVKADANAQRIVQLLEHHLLMQSRILDELRKRTNT